MFHQTGANPKSLHQRVTLSRLHRAHEPRLRAERRRIITEAGIIGGAAERLADATRGLNGGDLQAAIDRYWDRGTFPLPDHPTNTCDLSGYWLERLMDPRSVAATMTGAGFSSDVA